MKPMKRSFLFTLLMGCCLASSNQVRAGSAEDACYNSYTNCTGSVDRSSAAAYLSYWNTYNNACGQAYAALYYGRNIDWIAYTNNQNTAQTTWDAAKVGTTMLYSNLLAQNDAWYSSLTNPSCQDGATWSYNSGSYNNDENYAHANEDLGLNWCPQSYGIMSYMWASRIYNDDPGGIYNLNNIYNKACGTAYAVYDKNNTYENYIVGVQYDACSTTYANCMLSADCGENPANCCADGCAQSYNNSMHGAYSGYIYSIAGPYSSDVYALDMAGVTLGWNDSEAGRLHDQTCFNAQIDYFYNSGVMQNYTQLIEAFYSIRYTYQVTLCACTNGDCTAAAQAQWDADYATAEATNTVRQSALYSSYTNTTASAASALATTQANDANQYNNTVTSTDNAINNLFNSAENSYNNACNAASIAYGNCLDGCNGG